MKILTLETSNVASKGCRVLYSNKNYRLNALDSDKILHYNQTKKHKLSGLPLKYVVLKLFDLILQLVVVLKRKIPSILTSSKNIKSSSTKSSTPTYNAKEQTDQRINDWVGSRYTPPERSFDYGLIIYWSI